MSFPADPAAIVRHREPWQGSPVIHPVDPPAGPGLSPAWNVYTFNKSDDDVEWRRERVADWRLEDAVRWAARRGDTILIEKDSDPTWAIRGITNHGCRDPDCPGGC